MRSFERRFDGVELWEFQTILKQSIADYEYISSSTISLCFQNRLLLVKQLQTIISHRNQSQLEKRSQSWPQAKLRGCVLTYRNRLFYIFLKKNRHFFMHAYGIYCSLLLIPFISQYLQIPFALVQRMIK